MNLINRALIVLLLACSTANADWIHGQFSERAGIDSLERFLVLRDSEVETWFGDQILSLGDINGDGAADILINRRGESVFDPWPTFLYYGGTTADTIPDEVFWSFQTWINPVGDINGDGYVDIAQTRFPPPYLTEFYFGGPEFDDSADFVIPNIASEMPPAGDLDGDGALDIAFSRGVNGAYVNIYRIDSLRDTIPEYVIPDTATSFARNLTLGDFNGDGWDDLAAAAYYNRDTNFVKFYWGGPDFDTVADFMICDAATMSFGKFLVPLGDFNGDGNGDIYIGTETDIVPMGIYFGGPDIDDEIDVITNQGSCGYSSCGMTSADLAGDVNNDGYPDLLIGYTTDPNTDINQVHVFLGGPDLADVVLSDIFLDRGAVPGPQAFFGRVVRGIGDFTGDGIDDFAASSHTAPGGIEWYAEVNIFSGYQAAGTTHVDWVRLPSEPDDFSLSQNYPNPFNSETTIEFSLPSRGQVKLTIYNVLGQEVCALVDDVLPTGVYRVKWRGQDNGRKALSSGVYVYRLSWGGAARSGKLVLLK